MMKPMIALLILALSCYTTVATTVIANGWVWKGSADEAEESDGASSESSNNNNNSNLRGIRTSEPQQEAAQPQHIPKTSTDNNRLLKQTFVQNMLINQGCPTTSACGDVCYVLTTGAASDLHSVATGTTKQPTHHWNDPSTFWRTGVCSSKAQCVSVNPFDKRHSFNEMASKLADVERDCERSVGMASLFLLAKAMDPASNVRVQYPNALV